jgi:hypothetical protein
VRFVAIHDLNAWLQPGCNIRSPFFARATSAHRRRPFMTIFASLMLTAITLYMLVQVDEFRS